MWTVTPMMAIMILVAIGTIAAFIALLSNPESYNSSRIYVFITTLSSLAIFLTFLFYYSVVDLQQQQRRQAVVQETSRISEIIQVNFSESISKYAKEIPGFVAELLPLTDISPEESTVDEEDRLLMQALSYQIFSVWQDIVLSTEFIAIDYSALVANALQRASSSRLFKIWKTQKIDFSDKTQKFGDRVFSKAAEIKEKTPEAYEKAAKELLCIKDFRLLFPRDDSSGPMSFLSNTKKHRPKDDGCPIANSDVDRISPQ